MPMLRSPKRTEINAFIQSWYIPVNTTVLLEGLSNVWYIGWDKNIPCEILGKVNQITLLPIDETDFQWFLD